MERLSPQGERLLYGMIVLAALAVRLAALGNAPLSAQEAKLALTALEAAKRAHPAFGSQPALAAFTSLVFFLLGRTDAMARLIPALAGGLLPLLAWPLRRRLGRLAALLFACALAFDPGLVALSRVANSPIPALLLGMGAFLLAADNRWEYALPLGVLAVLFGPSFWFGMLVLLIAALLGWAFGGVRLRMPRLSKRVVEGGFWALALIGTLFYWSPGVLGAALNSLVGFVSVGRGADSVSAFEAVFILLAYSPLAVGAALVGLFLAWRAQSTELPAHSRWLRGMLIFLAAALVALFVYPLRPVAFLAWVLPTLWLVAAWALSRLPKPSTAASVHAVLIFLLFSFVLLNTFGFANSIAGSKVATARLVLIALTFLLMLAATALLAWGWTLDEALSGFAWGATIFVLVLNLSALYRAAYAPRPREFWYGEPASPNVRLLQRTVADFGNWVHGRADTLTLLDLTNSPALAWDFHSLHTYKAAVFTPPRAKPEAAITARNAQPPKGAAYTGQDFRVTARTVFPFANLREALKWLAFRQSTLESRSDVLWIRNDLFAGAKK